MTPSPILIPRHKLRLSPSKQEQIDPLRRICGISTSTIFAIVVAVAVALYEWPRRWLMSGSPILTYAILLGAQHGYRILPFLHIWTLLATVNLVYAVAATSWLLYGAFVAACYPAIFITCVFQFNPVAGLVRRNLRALLKQPQFINDKIAYFNIPALEIDTDVTGLMVIRGLTIHLSTLTIVAHGIELGIKLSDDMEIAIQTEEVRIALFRRIEIGDIYANLKGGQFEMTFHQLGESTKKEDGSSLMDTNTPLLRAATSGSESDWGPKKVSMTEVMTEGGQMKDSSAKAGMKSVEEIAPDEDTKRYLEKLKLIHETSTIHRCRQHLKERAAFDIGDLKEMRAAICSQLHVAPSVPHPPQRSVKVTTLRKMSPHWQRHLMHRLPMLLRLLLSPLSYFHPIGIASITAAGSGKWVKKMLLEHVFMQYGEVDAEVRRLEARISTWLADANFALQLANVAGVAQVPFLSEYDINAYLGFGDVLAYRTRPEDLTQKEVVRFGGADATFTIPSFLLPHHEHLLPPVPTAKDKMQLQKEVYDADGKPKTLQAKWDLMQAEKDEANINMSVHVSLPACLDQELLNFIAALVKATKVVEMEKQADAMDDESIGFRDYAKSLKNNEETLSFGSLAKNLNKRANDGMKKAMVGGMVNDRWIAKMVGKITKKLETAQGEVGYSGNIPVALDTYRPKNGVKLPSKLLP